MFIHSRWKMWYIFYKTFMKLYGADYLLHIIQSNAKLILLFFFFMCFSCHIRHLTKCPNWCRTWNICFHLIFSWKMLKPNFAFWDILMLLRCLNSKEIKLQSSINVICIIFDLIFFQLKIKRKQIFQVRHQFGHFVKCRIWHELRIWLTIRPDQNLNHNMNQF